MNKFYLAIGSVAALALAAACTVTEGDGGDGGSSATGGNSTGGTSAGGNSTGGSGGSAGTCDSCADWHTGGLTIAGTDNLCGYVADPAPVPAGSSFEKGLDYFFCMCGDADDGPCYTACKDELCGDTDVEAGGTCDTCLQAQESTGCTNEFNACTSDTGSTGSGGSNAGGSGGAGGAAGGAGGA